MPPPRSLLNQNSTKSFNTKHILARGTDLKLGGSNTEFEIRLWINSFRKAKQDRTRVESLGSFQWHSVPGQEALGKTWSTLSIQVLMDIDKIPQSLIQSEQPWLSQLQSLHHLYGPVGILSSMSCLFHIGGSALDTALQVLPHQCQAEGKDHFPPPAGNSLLNAAQNNCFLKLIHFP